MKTGRLAVMLVVLLSLALTSVSFAQIDPAARARALVPKLASSNEQVRALATFQLVDIGAPAVPVLMDAMKFENSRQSAMIALKQIGAPAVPFLMRDLRSSDDQTVARAVLELGFMGYSDWDLSRVIVPKLIAMLKQEPGTVFNRSRATAAVTLAAIGSNAVLDVISVLDDPDVKDRQAAILALGIMRRNANMALPKLDRMARSDPDEIVRLLARRTATFIREQ